MITYTYSVCITMPKDEYWQNHPELHDVPIYYASQLAKKCMSGTVSMNLPGGFLKVHILTLTGLVLKGQCHKDFAVLGQFCAKIMILRL